MDKFYSQGEQIKSYTIIKMIGQGRYGIVYLAKNHISQKLIIKQLKKDIYKENKEKSFYEIDILKKLNKLNNHTFPQLIDNLYLDGVPIYVLEYIEGVVFEDLIVKYNHEFNKKEIYEIAEKILDIIENLQQNNIVHRDIRPPNLILKNNKDISLIDFGLARYIDDDVYKKEMDYWYLGDFLIHLLYTSYFDDESNKEERPWFDELSISKLEKLFIMRLMGMENSYKNIEEIRYDLKVIND